MVAQKTAHREAVIEITGFFTINILKNTAISKKNVTMKNNTKENGIKW